MQAAWHPLVDLAVVGRYPHDQFPGWLPGERRSVDVLDPDSGATLLNMTTPGIDKIISLNAFSNSGDALLSGMSGTVLIWKKKPRVEEDEVEGVYQTRESNVEDLKVEEWPEFKPIKRPREKKMKKKLDGTE